MEYFTDETPRVPIEAAPGTYRSPIRGTLVPEEYGMRTRAEHALYTARDRETKPSRTGRTPRRSERLLLQSMVSAVLLAVLLFANVIDFGPTRGAMTWLKTALAENSIGSAVASAWSATQSFFTTTAPAQAKKQEESHQQNEIQSMPPTISENIGQERIDEDILDALHNTPDLYNPKNR